VKVLGDDEESVFDIELRFDRFGCWLLPFDDGVVLAPVKGKNSGFKDGLLGEVTETRGRGDMFCL
jgi:hypothetical protein